MGKKLFWKILVACFLALSALFTVAGSMIISWIPPVQERLLTTVAALAILGALLTLAGLLKAHTRGKDQSTTGDSALADGIHPLAFIGYLHFWGGVLVISAAPMFFLNRYQQAGTSTSEPPPKIVAAARAPVQFPDMKLQGIVYNSERSAAVIDGQTVLVGEMLHGVKIVAIDSSGVTLEMQGVTNRLALE